MPKPNAPLFCCPVNDGVGDPTLIYNRKENNWWMFYTRRRANVNIEGVGWVYLTQIGIAISEDGCASFRYLGTAQGLEFERGENTFWAPEVIYNDGIYHMYVSYIRGGYTKWNGKADIVHFTSEDLYNWTFQSIVKTPSNMVIDACVHPLPNGKFRMWYKDQDRQSHTCAADSDDLYNWEFVGEVITDCSHEGPNVFFFKGKYFLITDAWSGLGVYSSTDCESWTRQEENLLNTPGSREQDNRNGGHPDIVVEGDRAFIFYFVHPQRSDDRNEGGRMEDGQGYALRRSVAQVAELELIDGKLCCDRDKDFDICL